MSRFTPVRWREGMFLRPHHFQQHDAFLETREVHRARLLHGEGWGVARLEVEELPLASYTFQLRALEAVLPDGTLLDIPRNGRVAQRSFEKALGRAGRSLDVAIGVPGREEQRAQATNADVADATARYVGGEAEFYDIETGHSPAVVEDLRYNVRLFFGDESTAGYETLPLARLRLTGEPGRPVELDPTFAPPCLSIAAAPALTNSLRAVTERVSLSLRQLGGETVDETRPRSMVLYGALSAALPVLRDLLDEAHGHPRVAFRELARLAGALAQPGRARVADDLPAYQHRDPAPLFEEMRQLIIEWSTPAIDRRWVRVELTRDKDLFAGAIPAFARERGARVILEIHAAESAPRVKTMMLGAKISGPSRIETLQTYLLPGVGTEVLSGPPSELPPGPVGAYFRLKIEDNTEWEQHVLPDGTLAVFVLGCPSDVRVSLVAIRPAVG